MTDGVHAEVGEVCKLTLGDHKGKWGVLVEVKMAQCSIRCFDGQLSPLHRSDEFRATRLTLKKFMEGKRCAPTTAFAG